jgi:hypothetical protein
MKLIVLDIDGVLNDHKAIIGHYCGIEYKKAKLLNQLLRPEVKLLLSSAWRYMIHAGSMTEKGFEFLLTTHGIDAIGRIIGITAEDEDIPKREQQISAALIRHRPERFVIFDDLALKFPDKIGRHFIQVNGKQGLKPRHIAKASAILRRRPSLELTNSWGSYEY